MPSLTIKSIPVPLLERLRERAAEEHRSLNRQVIHLLELALSTRGLDVDSRTRRQMEEWRDLMGRWASDETLEEETRRVRDARSPGRALPR